MVQVVESIPCGRQEPVYHAVDNNMASDDLVMQVARASAAMVMINFSQNSLLPAPGPLLLTRFNFNTSMDK